MSEEDFSQVVGIIAACGLLAFVASWLFSVVFVWAMVQIDSVRKPSKRERDETERRQNISRES